MRSLISSISAKVSKGRPITMRSAQRVEVQHCVKAVVASASFSVLSSSSVILEIRIDLRLSA
jgi:hypothetical protein